MLKDWQNKYLMVLLVFLAFIDGMLVAGQFQGKQIQPVEGRVLEDQFEQKMSSIAQISLETQKIPFTTQAPYGIWEDPWASFAEEACAYMANQWAHEAPLDSKDKVAAALLAEQDWEKKNVGTYVDTSTAQTLRLLTEFYNLKAEISADVTEENIRIQVDSGKILLVPVQNLKNPHYGEPGPVHHMILIYGYEGENLLVNDPGTLRGEAYAYDFQKILEAVQDLDGEKNMIVISR